MFLSNTVERVYSSVKSIKKYLLTTITSQKYLDVLEDDSSQAEKKTNWFKYGVSNDHQNINCMFSTTHIDVEAVLNIPILSQVN